MKQHFYDARMDQEHPHWGKLVPGAAKQAFGDLTTYLDLQIEPIIQEYWQRKSGADAIAQRQVAEATEETTVLSYYAVTPQYLYELSYWEASLDKQRWFRVLAQACRKYGLKRVLDFGGGIGGLTLYLRAHGIQCDYLDVPGQTFDYAQWRFARYAFPVTRFDAAATDGLPWGSYDAVIAWDVLEHLFDLEAAIRKIARLLRSHGWLLSKSTFAASPDHHHHVHLAKHACYGDIRQFNQLVAQVGFDHLGQLKPGRLSNWLRACGVRSAVVGVRIVPRLKYGGNFTVHTLGPSCVIRTGYQRDRL